MSLYNTICVIIVLTAAFGYINHRYIKMPQTIGIMIMSLVTSLVIIAINWLDPALFLKPVQIIKSLDFYTLLMKIMLSFLLFAGSLHLDAHRFKKHALSIFTFSTIGVIISTFLVGLLFYFAAGLFNLHITFIEALLFGALISPTDPIAVLGILRQANIPASLEIKITGESLFNDGVAIVVFLTIYHIMQAGVENLSIAGVGLLFLREACGGVLLGFGLGYCGYFILKSINNYKTEALITLAIVMGGYLVADRLHVSGPLAMVVAGIITGNKSMRESMSPTTHDYVAKLWELIDDILNAILFLLIGLEMLVIPFSWFVFCLGLVGILIVLLSRYISVAIPIALLKYRIRLEKHAALVLTWGGLRGGISVALALSLPAGEYNNTLIAVTYMIVLFSIVVQGLTIGSLVKRTRQ